MNSKQDKLKEDHNKTHYSQLTEMQRQRRNWESIKKEVTRHIQRILNEIKSWFLLKYPKEQRQWDKESWKKLIINQELMKGTLKAFLDKQKLRGFITYRPVLH